MHHNICIYIYMYLCVSYIRYCIAKELDLRIRGMYYWYPNYSNFVSGTRIAIYTVNNMVSELS